MHRPFVRLAFAALLGAALAIPMTARAQDAAASTAAPVASSLSGPRLATLGTAFDRSAAPAVLAVPPQEMRHSGTDVAMMIVGGTALIVGLSVGGDGGQIIAVAGSVIGLIGLFRYLR